MEAVCPRLSCRGAVGHPETATKSASTIGPVSACRHANVFGSPLFNAQRNILHARRTMAEHPGFVPNDARKRSARSWFLNDLAVRRTVVPTYASVVPGSGNDTARHLRRLCIPPKQAIGPCSSPKASRTVHRVRGCARHDPVGSPRQIRERALPFSETRARSAATGAQTYRTSVYASGSL